MLAGCLLMTGSPVAAGILVVCIILSKVSKIFFTTQAKSQRRFGLRHEAKLISKFVPINHAIVPRSIEELSCELQDGAKNTCRQEECRLSCVCASLAER